MRALRLAFLVLVIVLVCLMALAHNARAKARLRRAETGATAADAFVELVPLVLAGGGRARTCAAAKVGARSENVVVDTLNLAHWLGRRAGGKKLEQCDIVRAIEDTAPLLRRRFPGRVVYVTKDRETAQPKAQMARTRALYQAAARRNCVYVHVVERGGADEAGRGHGPRARRRRPHSALGRDDFYLIMLAQRYRCAVLSRDRFRDLPEMKAGNLAPFQVWSFSPARPAPERDFVNPAAPEFRRLRRPATLDFPAVLPHL